MTFDELLGAGIGAIGSGLGMLPDPTTTSYTNGGVRTPTVAEKAQAAASQNPSGMFGWVQDITGSVYGATGALFQNSVGTLEGGVQQVANGVTDAVTTAFGPINTVYNRFTDTTNSLYKTTTGVVEQVGKLPSQLVTGATNLVSSGSKTLASGVKSLSAGVSDTLKEFIPDLKSPIEGLNQFFQKMQDGLIILLLVGGAILVYWISKGGGIARDVKLPNTVKVGI